MFGDFLLELGRLPQNYLIYVSINLLGQNPVRELLKRLAIKSSYIFHILIDNCDGYRPCSDKDKRFTPHLRQTDARCYF